jgi:glycosyltransferase involved in cell wall biosynthesis
MAKVNVLGNIFGTSGYASHTRQLVNSMYKLNQDVALTANLMQGWETQVNDAELVMIKKEAYDDESYLAISKPDEWLHALSQPHKKFVGYCVWEGTKVPEFWIDIFMDSRVDYIIVPSKHTKDAILATDVEAGAYTVDTMALADKIIVIPHGVDHNIFYPLENKKDDGVFRFICNGGWAFGANDRKGIQFLLQAFNAEFKPDEKVQLVVKINPAYIYPGWNIMNEINKLGLDPSGNNNISININNDSFDAIRQFYWQGDVFVCPTMGEAFGLPMLESMACGVPVITTNFGGQTDFINKDNGWLVDYDLVENTWDVMYEGVSWAKPNIKQLRKVMRDVFANREQIKEKSLKSIQKSKEYSWDITAKRILEKL